MVLIDWGSPWATFVLAALLSGLAGMARTLARRRRRGICDVFVGSLYSAVWGLGIALLWYDQFRSNTYTLLGGCILAALAGTLSAQEVLTWLRMGLKAIDVAATASASNRRKAASRERDDEEHDHDEDENGNA